MPLIFFTLVAFLASSSQQINAHSTAIRPLKRIGHPSILSLEIFPRLPSGHTSSNWNWDVPALPAQYLRFDDSFRLTISAFKETFYLHLRPNDHLVHSAARVNYYTRLANGQEVLSHSEPLLRHQIKVYHGEVIAAHHSAVRMREDAARMYPHPHPAVLGWARLMVHNQGDPDRDIAPVFEGAFSVNGVMYHIMMKDNYLRNKNDLDPDLPIEPSLGSDLVIWRDADEMTVEEEHFARTGSYPIESIKTPPSCGHDRLDYNVDHNPVINAGICGLSWIEGLLKPSSRPLYRRDDAPTGNGGIGTDFRSSIGSVDGCPKTQKVLYMGVAADCTYVSVYGSKEKATTQILNTWNSASSLYKTTFNVSLGISEIQIRDPTCPSTVDPNFSWNVACSGAELDTRLSLFSKWRGDKGADGVGLWHLMSGCPTGSEVGIAWLGTLCQSTASGKSPTTVSGAAVSTSGRTEWQVVAHEIGHNFGAIHDCNSVCSSSPPCCPLSSDSCSADGRFIMNPVSQSGEKVFSPCSLGNICSMMGGTSGGRVNTTCLLDPDQARKTISLQMCGNGIVEPGEDCDSGTGVESKCCDVQTCKFKNGAKCDPKSSSCCTEDCIFAPVNQVCRPSRDPKCDTAEFCTGNSSTCPPDITVPNGQKCGDNKLACASGLCTSVSQQCQAVGAPMNLSQACPDQNDQTCQISCQDPRNPNSCVQLTSLLIDGSPCGFGGTCTGGRCEAASVLNAAKAWYTSNLQISIPITVAVAVFALLFLICFCRAISRCWRRKQQAAGPTHAGRTRLGSSDDPTRVVTHMRGASAPATRAPPIAHGSRRHRHGRHYAGSNRGDWVDETAYNGPSRRPQPPWS